MTANPVTCSPRDTLATVSQQVWDWDCGVVPVVDDGQLCGVITDRDICMALLFKGEPPAAVTVARSGPAAMPVWGATFQDRGKDTPQEREVREKIRDLLAYIESLQTPRYGRNTREASRSTVIIERGKWISCAYHASGTDHLAAPATAISPPRPPQLIASAKVAASGR